ncbi:MAG: RNA polymerase sigma factor [Candidatus Andeanibacterium colombiense]|uniref:RNA polymerase sigma factor n=1 Tax=Candidatus Andeanibacterium colombiense TaxID=3121345 RepID=A0AAJ6BNB9_9SPHN|nr:MAG: RNA polymerase sigma factor [Sphingomonadaceae bacterium]
MKQKPSTTVVKLDTQAKAGRGREGAPAHGGGAGGESLGQVYVRRYGAMRDFIRRRVGSAEVAEELIQDAWVAIAPRAEDPAIENPEAWLQRVVVNLTLNWLKTNQFRSHFVVEEERGGESGAADAGLAAYPDDRPNAERVLHYRQGLDRLMLLIDDLPPGRRAAFLLCRGEGLSLGEAAARLQISIKTVSGQVSAAVRSLREELIAAGLWP